MGEHYSITLIREDDPVGCEWCEIQTHRLVFERLEKNGGWSHLFCLPESRFSELQSLMARAADLLSARRELQERPAGLKKGMR